MRIAPVLVLPGALLCAAHAWAQPGPSQPPADAVVEEATEEDLQAPASDAAPAAAPVDDGSARGPAPTPTGEEPVSRLEDFRHRHQVSARATFGKGYRLAFAYGDNEVCGGDPGEPDPSPCYSASPAFTDLDLSFGLTDGLEISALVRLGLESEWTGGSATSRPLTLGLGIRAYADPPARVKVFVGARVLYDLAEAGASGKHDLAIRAEPGLQIEIIRYVALYVQAGATIGFLRWLRFEVDGGGGIQLRVP